MALILAAEHDPAARDGIGRILGRAGHRTVTVTDGESALCQIREHRPDLVFADVDMPLINGFLLCDEIRRDPLLHDTPVILVTGVVDPDDHRASEVGATGVLVKPYTAADLLERLRRHLPAGATQAARAETVTPG